MRKWIAAVLLCGIAFALYLWLVPRPARVAAPAPPGNTPSIPASVSNSFVKRTINPLDATASPALPSEPVPPPSPSFSSSLQITNISPPAALEHLRHVFHQYASMFGGNPVGTNPEITAALNGDNPKQANFIDPEAGMRIDSQGALIDPWGTPYFFHQLSGQEMEIHCAGPDRKMWTADDLVVK